jgi:hypothetical protein
MTATSGLRAKDPNGTRLALLGAGFTPLPARGKKVLVEGWSLNCVPIEVTESTIIRWGEDRPYDRNSSVAAFNTPFFDIDITHRALAEFVHRELSKQCGGTIYRVGNEPKVGVPFRCAIPFKKRVLRFVARDGVAHAVELLGAGQQFVAYGRHPSTRRPYEWHGGDLIEVGRNGLPEITEATAYGFLDYLRATLANANCTKVRISGSLERPVVDQVAQMNPPASWAWSPRDVDYFRNEVLTKIPGDIDYEHWFLLACGLYAKDMATSDDCEIGWLLFFEWSYRHEDTIGAKTPEQQWTDLMHRGWGSRYAGPGTILKWFESNAIDGLDNSFDDDVTERLKLGVNKLKNLKSNIQARQDAERVSHSEALSQEWTQIFGS